LREAANDDISDALYDLAVCHEMGVGIKQNLRMAAESYLNAALLGDGQSTYEVGRCCFYGIGFEENRRVARIWLYHARRMGIDE